MPLHLYAARDGPRLIFRLGDSRRDAGVTVLGTGRVCIRPEGICLKPGRPH